MDLRNKSLWNAFTSKRPLICLPCTKNNDYVIMMVGKLKLHMRNWPYIIYVIRTNKQKHCRSLKRLFLNKCVRQASAYWCWLHALATHNSNPMRILLFYVVQRLRKVKKAEINNGARNGPFCHAVTFFFVFFCGNVQVHVHYCVVSHHVHVHVCLVLSLLASTPDSL